MKPEFRRAGHTIVISDLHLTSAELPHPRKPLWKKYKQRSFFIDDTFSRFLSHIRSQVSEPAELVLNGDIFDFDSVMSIPEGPWFPVSWLERKRGLSSEEAKSRYKIDVILKDHYVWVQALHDFIVAGNRVVFIIGNHDMELHWPAVQAAITEALEDPHHKDLKTSIRFCEWFYISNSDTLIEHGNQYDCYTLCSNPIHPLIKKTGKMYVRLPFGNLANKFMLNGMGLFNPYVKSQYIMSFTEYVRFFFKYIIRSQPFLLLTWFWGAVVTLIYSLVEGFLPAVKDPLTVEARIASIAYRANASPRIVRSLKEIHIHPAHYNPFQILKELWLDRAILFGLVIFSGIESLALLKLVVDISLWWMVIPIMILMPFFVFYARSIKSDVDEFVEQAPAKSVSISSRLAKVTRVIHGHTHHEIHTWSRGVELINTGTWSPMFKDVECTQRSGRKPFAWIKPSPSGQRAAELHEWKDPGSEIITPVHTEPLEIAQSDIAPGLASIDMR